MPPPADGGGGAGRREDSLRGGLRSLLLLRDRGVVECARPARKPERADVLAPRALPRGHRPRLASTNPLGRLNGAIKRRTDVAGLFPNAAAVWSGWSGRSCRSGTTSERAVARRHMTPETIRPGAATEPVSPPAAAG